MSTETSAWLNQNTLIGFTEDRGNAWHYRASSQGEEANHYPHAIPVADVTRRLFHWQAIEITARFNGEYVDANGEVQTLDIVDNTRKGIIRSDTGEVLSVFKSGYKVHPYRETLIDPLENILDQGLAVGSAGLLRGGAVAWVQAEMPDTLTTPEGVSFRPFISAATSLDGSLSSTFWTGAQLIVCDNTLSAALSDKTAMVKVKHSKNSLPKVGELRNALGIVFQVGEDFAAQVKQLCETKVSDKQWQGFVEEHTELNKRPEAGAARTRAENKVAALTQLWNTDTRVSPWKNTAFGVVQAVNTYAHHLAVAKNGKIVERNMLRVVNGEVDDMDAATMNTLNKVLVNV